MTTPDPTATVVLAVHTLSEALERELVGACAKSRVKSVSWSGGELPGLEHPPVLVVAGLEAGKRRIPDDLVALMTRTVPGLPLLLLCNEPLMRPTVSVQSGRVTLVAPPFSASKLSAQMRILLADLGTAPEHPETFAFGSEAAGLPRGPAHFTSRELLGSRFWVAGMALNPEGGEATVSAPTLLDHAADGLTVVVSTHPAQPLEIDLPHVAEILRREERDEVKQSALESALGASAGVLFLGRAADELVCFWPDPSLPLGVFSTLRLPNLFMLSRTVENTGAPLLRFPARPGDLFLALASQHWSASVDPAYGFDRDQLSLALNDGGPALLDHLEESLRQVPSAIAGAVLEVR